MLFLYLNALPNIREFYFEGFLAFSVYLHVAESNVEILNPVLIQQICFPDFLYCLRIFEFQEFPCY